MLDIKFVRENKEKVKENIKKKFQEHKLPLVDEVIELDEKIRTLKLEGDNLRSNRNTNFEEFIDYCIAEARRRRIGH
jgi:seryl-tRNA synthetase